MKKTDAFLWVCVFLFQIILGVGLTFVALSQGSAPTDQVEKFRRYDAAIADVKSGTRHLSADEQINVIEGAKNLDLTVTKISQQLRTASLWSVNLLVVCMILQVLILVRSFRKAE